MSSFDEKDALEYIRRRVEETRTPLVDLGRAWGKSDVDDPGNYVTKTLKGVRQLKLGEFLASREFFGDPIGPSTILIRGKVGAGGHVHGLDAGVIGEVTDEDGYKPGTSGLEVEGDSMGDAYPDGSIVMYDTVYDYPQPFHLNSACVVWRTDGKTMLKMLLKGSRPDRWSLRSLNGGAVEADVFIDYIAKVTGVKFR